MSAAIYARVSTEEQARSGYSIADQIRRCKEKLLKLGITDIKEFVDDGYSGEFMERPALDELRQNLRNKKITTVIIYDLDRLSRETEHLLILVKEIEKRAKLVFVTNEYAKTPAGELFLTLHAGIAKYEKAMIKERTMRGKREKALAGKLIVNGNPLGYDFDKEKQMYVVNEREAETIRLIFDLYINNNYGTRQLVRELKLLGKVNKKGQPLTASNILRILKSELYAGVKWSFQRYDKKIGQKKVCQLQRDQSEWVAINVPPIISREIWEKAQQIIKFKSISSKRNKKYEYLIANIIRCGGCGFAMTGQTYKTFLAKRKKDYSYYTCSSIQEKRGCTCKRIPVKELDTIVWEWISKFLLTNYDLNDLCKIFPGNQQNKPTRDALSQHIEELLRRQANIIKWVTSGTVDMSIAEKDLKKLSKEITTTRNLLNSTLPQVSLPVSRNKILDVNTFTDKRDIMLKLGITIMAIREGNKIKWWFV